MACIYFTIRIILLLITAYILKITYRKIKYNVTLGFEMCSSFVTIGSFSISNFVLVFIKKKKTLH